MKRIPRIVFFLSSLLVPVFLFAQMGTEGTAISLSVTPRVCPVGQPVTVKGTILVNNKAQPFSMNITFPDGNKKTITGETTTAGEFSKPFSETQTAGWYAAEIIAADGKGKESDSFYVASPIAMIAAYANRMNALNAQVVRNINLSLTYLDQMTADGLDEKKEKLRTALGRMHELKQKFQQGNTQFAHLSEQIINVPGAINAMGRHNEALSAWTEEADNTIPQMEVQAKQYENISNSCEAINGVIELCGLVSWIMNFQGGLAKIFLNIASDKVLPGAVDRVQWTGGDEEKEAKKMAINEIQKTMTAASLGVEELAGFIKTGVIGDVVQFIAKVLYAKRCIDLKGPANAQFSAKFLEKGAPYWTYGITLKGSLTLRYEKTADLSKPVEVTGEFEGYKAKYDFWESVERVEPFPSSVKLIKRIRKSPTVINSSPVSSDLGLAGRTVTPGTYRVKVKGRINDNQIVLEVVRSPFDRLELESKNKMMLIMQNLAMPVIPLVKKFDFPIAKSRVVFVVGLGENYSIPLIQENDKLLIKKSFTNSRTMGNSNDIKLETKIDLNLSN